MAERLIVTTREFVKPTTRTPPPGSVVAVRSFGRERLSLGYYTTKDWQVSGVGSVPLRGVSEWAHIDVTHDHGVDLPVGGKR